MRLWPRREGSSLDLLVVVLKGFETPPNPVSIVRPFIEQFIVPSVLV